VLGYLYSRIHNAMLPYEAAELRTYKAAHARERRIDFCIDFVVTSLGVHSKPVTVIALLSCLMIPNVCAAVERLPLAAEFKL
jgi:hypothetical protein